MQDLIHKYSTRAKAESASQLLPESTGALDKMRVRLNILNKVPKKRVFKKKSQGKDCENKNALAIFMSEAIKNRKIPTQQVTKQKSCNFPCALFSPSL